jgi:hypothetical protein
MSALVIGYNVEGGEDPSGVPDFLESVRACHEDAEAPCTLYLRNDIAQKYGKQIAPFARNPLFDLQITIRGPLKTICQEAEGDTTVWPAADLEATQAELSEAVQTIADISGNEPIGLSDSMGAYRGLQDRPEILDMLDAHSIRYCRTYARNQFDWQPVDFTVEPFWYTFQGYAEIMEFPSQGWQQSILRKLYGWEDKEGYVGYIKEDADEVASRDKLVWSYWAQDWSAQREDSDLTIIQGLITHARSCGIEVTSQTQAYLKLRDEAETNDK